MKSYLVSILFFFFFLGSTAFASGPDCWGGEVVYDPNLEFKASGLFAGELSCTTTYDRVTNYYGMARKRSYDKEAVMAYGLSGCDAVEDLGQLLHSQFKDGLPATVEIKYLNRSKLSADCIPEPEGHACSFSLHFSHSMLSFRSGYRDLKNNENELTCQEWARSILESHQ